MSKKKKEATQTNRIEGQAIRAPFAFGTGGVVLPRLTNRWANCCLLGVRRPTSMHCRNRRRMAAAAFKQLCRDGFGDYIDVRNQSNREIVLLKPR